jgi:hypothetical protein
VLAGADTAAGAAVGVAGADEEVELESVALGVAEVVVPRESFR